MRLNPVGAGLNSSRHNEGSSLSDMFPDFPCNNQMYSRLSDAEFFSYRALILTCGGLLSNDSYLGDSHFCGRILFADAIPKSLSAFRQHILGIIFCRPKKQVKRIHTRRVITSM